MVFTIGFYVSFHIYL